MPSEGTETGENAEESDWLKDAPNKWEKETLEGLLPEGFLRNYGADYLNKLPNVQEAPLTPYSFLKPTNVSWVDYGVAYLLLYPYAILLLLALGLGVYLGVMRWKKSKELKRRLPCPVCHHPVYRCALFCPVCSAANSHPVTLDWMGVGKRKKPAVMNKQPELLRSFRRCPRCATPLPKASSRQNCPACKTPVFKSRKQQKSFDRFIQKRFWPVLLALIVIGFIPILGSLLAVSLYRRRLIEPYNVYISVYKEGFFVMLLPVLRLLFRLIPFVGIVGVPLLAITENYVYRRFFLRSSRSSLRGKVVLRQVSEIEIDGGNGYGKKHQRKGDQEVSHKG